VANLPGLTRQTASQSAPSGAAIATQDIERLTSRMTKHPTSRRLMLTGASSAVFALTAACGSSNGTTAAKSAPTPSATHKAGMLGISGGEQHADAGKGLLPTEEGYTFKPMRAALSVGRQTVSFQILDPEGRPQTEYVVDQTKLLHFYLVRLDLTGYRHLHPALANGTWSIEVTTPAPGPYRMYADFIAKDSSGMEHPLVLSTVLTVPGAYLPVQLPAPTTAATADGLTATLAGCERS
jgi:hypothetical protein